MRLFTLWYAVNRSFGSALPLPFPPPPPHALPLYMGIWQGVSLAMDSHHALPFYALQAGHP
jgi:hypothetical protein